MTCDINFVHFIVYVDDQSQCKERIILNYYKGSINYCGVQKYRPRNTQKVHLTAFLSTAAVTVHPGGCRLSMRWSIRLQEHDKRDICIAIPKPARLYKHIRSVIIWNPPYMCLFWTRIFVKNSITSHLFSNFKFYVSPRPDLMEIHPC